ncbi:MAG: hypothetical protein RMK29_17665 [Myxococcales bacterium]|nr:hypothetical protein [Myxococcota bacterium]MDW8283539.1 hypothetical protein [Myxococcales bacterium]
MTIVVDNGPDITGRAPDAWAYERGVKIHIYPDVIRPGHPIER